MSDYNRNSSAPFGYSLPRADQAVIDQGLRSYMLGIYNYMSIGLAITGLAAIGTALLASSNPAVAVALYKSPLKWVIMLAPLAFVFFLSFRIERMSASSAMATFFAFSAVMGISLSAIFLVFTGASIARVFFMTAATFGALSLWAYTTKKDLSGMGTFLMMGLFGIIIASLVNIFLGSTMLQFIVSVVGVLVFAGLTAYDTQKLKSEYIFGLSSADGETIGKSSVLGALTLYLDFINLFTTLLQLFGQRDE